MPSVARILVLVHPLYGKTELIEHRRNTSGYARSFPLGSERNRHRQIALSLRALLRKQKRLAHTPDTISLRYSARISHVIEAER
jgi:hypothetical protein